MMHRFKECFERISENSDVINSQKVTSDSKLCYYDYMAALVSIYLDISLNLKAKLKRYKIYEFRKKNLKETLCVNTYFLLDSFIYYIVNCLLQMNSINAENLMYIIPIINKIASQPSSCEKNLINFNRMPKSLYLRLLLLYRRLTISSKLEKNSKLLPFKNFINSIQISKRFSVYLNKLLDNYFDKIEARELNIKWETFKSNEELIEFLISKLTLSNIENFICALHKKSTGNACEKNCFMIEKIEEIKTVISGPKEKNPRENVNEEIQINQEIIEPNNQIDQENELNNSCEPEILNMYDELEFTSCSELTQYDINAYEYDIVDYDRVHQDEPTLTLPLAPTSNEPILIETAKYQLPNTKIPNDAKLTSDVEIVMQTLDLNRYRRLSKYSYDLSDRECDRSQGYFSQENTPNQTYMERVYSSRKKYEEISSRIKSPTKETISKLNLFRKIFDEEKEDKIQPTYENT